MTMLTVRNRIPSTTRTPGDVWGSSIFNDLFTDFSAPIRIKTQYPAVSTSETDTEHVISVAAPGLKKADFDIGLLNSELTITTKSADDTATAFVNSSWTRSWTVPQGTIAEDINAQYRSGVLSVRVSKVDPVHLKETIPVK